MTKQRKNRLWAVVWRDNHLECMKEGSLSIFATRETAKDYAERFIWDWGRYKILPIPLPENVRKP